MFDAKTGTFTFCCPPRRSCPTMKFTPINRFSAEELGDFPQTEVLSSGGFVKLTDDFGGKAGMWKSTLDECVNQLRAMLALVDSAPLHAADGDFVQLRRITSDFAELDVQFFFDNDGSKYTYRFEFKNNNFLSGSNITLTYDQAHTLLDQYGQALSCFQQNVQFHIDVESHSSDANYEDFHFHDAEWSDAEAGDEIDA